MKEAVITGIESVVNHEDCLITGYRDHCHAYTRGDTPKQIIAEMLGRITGSTKGKGGSMHYYRAETNWYGGNGIVGAQLPVGTGLGFALKYKGKKNCSVTMYGDGAANQGQLFESFNMAALWKLPVIYICENNNYAMGTSVERASANPNFYQRGDYIPGMKLNGQNVFAVKAGMIYARKHSIETGPIIIEAETYRYRGHSMSDPGTSYRSRDEVQEVRAKRDPIEHIKGVIREHEIATEAEIKKIETQIRNEINQAYEEAKKDPLPELEDLTKHVYVDNDIHFIRGVEYEGSVLPKGHKSLY